MQELNIACLVSYIITDREGTVRIIGQSRSHSFEVKQQSSMCNANRLHFDNDQFNYTYLEQSDMYQIILCDIDTYLLKFFTNELANIFSNVCFGDQ